MNCLEFSQRVQKVGYHEQQGLANLPSQEGHKSLEESLKQKDDQIQRMKYDLAKANHIITFLQQEKREMMKILISHEGKGKLDLHVDASMIV